MVMSLKISPNAPPFRYLYEFAQKTIGLRTLRLRLTLIAAAMIGSTLLVAGQSLTYIFEHHLEIRVEQELEVRWLELAGAVDADLAQTGELAKPLSDPRYQLPYSGAYWRVSENGATVLRSRSLWDQDITPSAQVHRSPTNKAIEARGPNQSVLYMTEKEVFSNALPANIDGGQKKLVLAVALDYADIENLRAAFEVDVTRALLAIAFVLVLGSWIQTSFGLRPLHLVKQRLALIHNGSASRLTGRFPSEVEPLALDVNKLLERQDLLVLKARNRAGDLAHGLKTPLTILRGEAEKLQRAGDRQTSDALQEQIVSMTAHINRELARARTHGIPAPGGMLTDPKRTVDRLIGLVVRMPRGDSLSFRNEVPKGLRLQMDPDDFGEVMGNLLDNARKFATAHVLVWVRAAPGIVDVIISDDGPGIPAGVRHKIMERGETALAQGEGSGLGLAIVQDILLENAMTLVIDDAPGGGCRLSFQVKSVTFELPRTGVS
ncbi:MAG: sensor histidine kinase [Beijerinckiaceae bacterium]